MSQLEDKAIPLLKPMLDGQTCRLDFWGQATVAAWATKTCFALQRARQDMISNVPDQHFRDISQRKGASPPRGVEVFIANMRKLQIEEGGRYHVYAYSTRKPEVNLTGDSPRDVLVYLLTLRIHHLVLQVVGSLGIPEEFGPWRHPFEPLHIQRIWPQPAAVVEWPPARPIEEGEGGFSLLASRPESWES